MIPLADWLSPATLRLLALALLHFLWQGVALAALAYVAMAFCRSAAARYAVAVGTMILMVSAPVTTFLIFEAREQAEVPPSSIELPAASSARVVLAPHLNNHKPSPTNAPPAYFLWLVEAWFAGVTLLGLRSAGGYLVVERLRRRESTPVHEDLMKVCLALERRMGLTRVIRYCQCVRLDAPAVAGWIRPVVFLPMTALTGLNATQLEAVIAHELAHIRRLDAFVNLFQIAVETLLFYHPAVWWVGGQIRVERENCCDDEAVALCGSPVNYARALAHMAEWQAAPPLVMAANHGSLAARVARLLGANESAGTYRAASLGAGVLCLSAALLAGSAFVGGARHVHAQSPAPAAQWSVPGPSPVPRQAGQPQVKPALVLELSPSPKQGANPPPIAVPGPPQQPDSPGKQSYIDGLKSAGLSNLTVDELIGLKVQGITPEYAKSMKDLGLKIDPDDLIGMKVQGITPAYVTEMRAATGQSLDADSLIGLKVQGVTPEYVKEMHALGLNTGADDIIGMKVQGITPAYVTEMRAATGQSLDADSLIGLKVQGVTPEYVKEMHALGLNTNGDDIIGMKVQGITPDYVKSIRALGLRPDAGELVGMKVQGITAEYLKGLESAGFKLNVDEAIGAKVQGITSEFIQNAHSRGFKDLTLDQLIRLKQSGVLDPEK